MKTPDSAHLEPQRLHAYLDDALSPEERRRLEAHVQTCAACSAELADLQALFAAIESLPDISLEHDLTPSVLAALPQQRLPHPRLVRWTSGIQLALAVIILALAAPVVMQGLVQPLVGRIPSLGVQVQGGAQALLVQVQLRLLLAYDLLFGQVAQQSGELAARWQAVDWLQILGWLWLLVPAALIWLVANTFLLKNGRHTPFTR